MNKVKASAMKVQARDGKLAKDINRMFKVLFIKGYVGKHQRWSKVTLTYRVINYIKHQHSISHPIDLHSPY